MHVTAGMQNFFTQQLANSTTLADAERYPKSQALTHPPRVHLPITIQIMEDIMQLLPQRPKSYTNVMYDMDSMQPRILRIFTHQQVYHTI